MKSLRFTRKQNEWKFSAEKLPKLAEQRAGSKRRRQRWRQQHRSEQKNWIARRPIFISYVC